MQSHRAASDARLPQRRLMDLVAMTPDMGTVTNVRRIPPFFADNGIAIFYMPPRQFVEVTGQTGIVSTDVGVYVPAETEERALGVATVVALPLEYSAAKAETFMRRRQRVQPPVSVSMEATLRILFPDDGDRGGTVDSVYGLRYAARAVMHVGGAAVVPALAGEDSAGVATADYVMLRLYMRAAWGTRGHTPLPSETRVAKVVLARDNPESINVINVYRDQDNAYIVDERPLYGERRVYALATVENVMLRLLGEDRTGMFYIERIEFRVREFAEAANLEVRVPI
jgi:hypothetical protein